MHFKSRNFSHNDKIIIFASPSELFEFEFKYNYGNITMTKKQIDYITCVIGALAQMTGKSCSQVYEILKSAGIIRDYLAAAYDVLHTFSLEYVAEDVI